MYFNHCVSILSCLYSMCIQPFRSLSTAYPSSPYLFTSTFSGLYLFYIHPTSLLSYFIWRLLQSTHLVSSPFSGFPTNPSIISNANPPPPPHLPFFYKWLSPCGLSVYLISLREPKSSIYQWKVVCEIEPSHYLSTFYPSLRLLSFNLYYLSYSFSVNIKTKLKEYLYCMLTPYMNQYTYTQNTDKCLTLILLCQRDITLRTLRIYAVLFIRFNPKVCGGGIRAQRMRRNRELTAKRIFLAWLVLKGWNHTWFTVPAVETVQCPAVVWRLLNPCMYFSQRLSVNLQYPATVSFLVFLLLFGWEGDGGGVIQLAITLFASNSRLAFCSLPASWLIMDKPLQFNFTLCLGLSSKCSV